MCANDKKEKTNKTKWKCWILKAYAQFCGLKQKKIGKKIGEHG